MTFATAVNPGWSAPDQYVTVVDDAVVTPFAARKVEGVRERFVTGAVHRPDGSLLTESQRVGGHAGDLVVAEDPETIDPAPEETIEGRWLYGGNLMGQFGHFICETVTNLWPEPDDVDGILFHSFIFGRTVSPWMDELVQMAGWGGRQLRVIGDQARVERLVLPTRPFTINVGAAPEAVAVWERMSPARPVTAAPVYLSRSRLRDDPRRTPRDEELDARFADLGFQVVHPQELGVREQVHVAQTAPVIAAGSGSALHLSAFASPGARIIEIGDARSHSRPLVNQVVIDAARGNETAFVPFLSRDGARDVEQTMAEVGRLLGRPRRRRGRPRRGQS
jgi:hypothetical protein